MVLKGDRRYDGAAGVLYVMMSMGDYGSGGGCRVI